MTNENDKVANHNKNFGLCLKQQKQINIYEIINSNLWIAKRSCTKQYLKMLKKLSRSPPKQQTVD